MRHEYFRGRKLQETMSKCLNYSIQILRNLKTNNPLLPKSHLM